MKFGQHRSVLFGVTGALLLGMGVAGTSRLVSALPGGWGWVMLMAVVGGFARWVRIPVEPLGDMDLGPVVYVVSAAIFGLWPGIVTAVLSAIFAFVLVRLGNSRISFMHLVGLAGESSLSLLVAASALKVVFTETLRIPEWTAVLALGVLTLGVESLLLASRLSVEEGADLWRMLIPALRGSLQHLGFILAAIVTVWGISVMIGPAGFILASAVMIEMYYPWKLLGEQKSLFLTSLQLISNAVDVKDPYTAHHSRRVSRYAVMIARVLRVPEDEVERIRIGALMHDIGKIGVPGRIIRKPSRLSEEEMNMMRRHVQAGAEIMEVVDVLSRSTDIVLCHHENYDGSGYPSGLAGEEIPLGARIVLVADAFDALTTDRPYRKGRSAVEALRVLESNASTQFDPRVVEALKMAIKVSA
jgi:putative nucleotidyltransferase with HDIG domain